MPRLAPRPILSLVAMLALGCGGRFPAAKPDERARELASPSVSRPLPASGLHVLVWNIKKTQHASWAADFERLVAPADLVLLQEAYDTPTFREGLGTRPDMQWMMGISFFFANEQNIATGVVNGSTASAESVTVVHAPKREPVFPTPKAALIATYPVHGCDHPLMVVDVHAINFRRAKHLRDHLAEVDEAIRQHPGPVLLAGDLNTHHRPRMKVLEAFAAEHQLQPAFPNWVEGKPRKPVVDGRMRHLWKWPLDHVYVRGLSVRWARVRPEISGSDHKPLEVVLDLDQC